VKHSFLNRNKVVPINTPGSTTSSAINSDWVSLAHGTGVVISLTFEEGRANQADDNTLTFRQAKTAAGGDAKALVPRRAYVRAHATDVPTAAAATPTVIEAVDGAIDIHVDGDLNQVIDVEFDASELDVNNDFKFVQARLAAVGSSTAQATMTAIACGLRQVLAPQHLADVLA